MRTEKSVKNMLYGIFLQIVTVFVGMFNRTVLIKYIGIEALSLNSLFTEVLSMMSLAELGVGAAITFSLYDPLANRDEKKISQLMNLFAKAYRIIAGFILVIGIILLPFIQYLINDINYPIGYIRLIFFLFVIQTSASYLFSYMGILITADQDRYIVTSVAIGIKIATAIGQIVILIVTKNYIAYLLCSLFFTVLNNVIVSIIAHKKYPFLNKSDKLEPEENKKIFSNIKNVFVAKISGTITNSTDNTLISVLVGTVYVGLYSNYAIFINVIKGLITQFTNSVTASFGNLLVHESGEYCDVVLKRTTYIVFVMGATCATGMYCALSTVIEIWLGPDFLIDDFTVFICVCCLYINIIRTPLWTILDASGLFKENSFTGVVGSAVNLVVSIVLGKILGMAGIFLGTISTYVLQGAMKIHYLYDKKLEVDKRGFSLKIVCYISLSLIQCVIAKSLCGLLTFNGLWINLFSYCAIAVVVSIVFDILLFIRSDEFCYTKELGIRLLRKFSMAKESKNGKSSI